MGGLPRSKAVADAVVGQERGEPRPDADAVIAETVRTVVARRVQAGVDVVSDGEMSKISYATYIKDRITGFAGDSERSRRATRRLFRAFCSARLRGQTT